MRTNEEIKIIEDQISDPIIIENFIDPITLQYLTYYFENSPNKIKKNTGPLTLDVDVFLFEVDWVFKKIKKKISEHLSGYEISTGLFFSVDTPHIIHNDDVFDKQIPYKAFTIPLQVYGKGIPSLCFFDQFYFHGPKKFFYGDENHDSYYNEPLYNYADVSFKNDNGISTEVYDSYLTHLKKEWLTDLSFHSALPWVPGTAIMFDSTRLHCASDFTKQDIIGKLGLSIFTRKI